MGQHCQRPGALGIIEDPGNVAITPLHELEDFHIALVVIEGAVAQDALEFVKYPLAEALERERVYTP